LKIYTRARSGAEERNIYYLTLQDAVISISFFVLFVLYTKIIGMLTLMIINIYTYIGETLIAYLNLQRIRLLYYILTFEKKIMYGLQVNILTFIGTLLNMHTTLETHLGLRTV
jgi:hypothetical protein